MSYIVVLSTISNKDEAKKIAKELIKEKLAACVNIIENVTSIYEWKGEICEDGEFLMIIKSKKHKFSDIEKKIKELHSYELPEIISFEIKEGYEKYLEWIEENIK